MLSLESALKILKKYGYNSKNVHPYLYKKNNEIGLNYSYIDSKYGVTERVISFYSDLEFEKFLKRFQWYKLNGKKLGVTMRLNNYEIVNPEVLYIRNNHVMTDDEIFDMDSFDKKIAKNKRLSNTKRLLVEVENLMSRYYLEKNSLEKYTNNLFNKENELGRYYLELQKLVDNYNHEKKEYEIIFNKKQFSVDLLLESDINKLLSDYKRKIPNEEKLNNLLIKAWTLNKELELNANYMYALKNNDDIDEEMRLVVTKIDFMKELLSKKRRFKIINLQNIFNNIDKQSTYESLYDDNFYKKYNEFVDNKYDVLDKVDHFRLCEYLNNFKTHKMYDIEKNINRCKDAKEEKNNYDNNYDYLIKDLKKQYNSLNINEKAALILYSSFFHDLFLIIQSVEQYDSISANKLASIVCGNKSNNKLVDDCYNNFKDCIDLLENKKVKKNVFLNVSFDSKIDFINSIRKNVIILENINEKMSLKYNFKLYFSTNDFNDIEKYRFIKTSTIIAPYMINSNDKNYRVIDANLRKGVNILCSLETISLNNNIIELIGVDNPEIFLDSKDITIIKDSNLVVYSKIKKNLVNTNNYSYVNKIDIDYKININKVVIERRISNE